MIEGGGESGAVQVSPPQSEIDFALTIQLAVAWAGEAGSTPRLGWWRSELVSEFGGEDLFRRLLPATWQWGMFEAAREAALRTEGALRRVDPEPDRIVSLYCLGTATDERINQRLIDLKRSGRPPMDALPGLSEVVLQSWNGEHFFDWVISHGSAETVATSIGRRLKRRLPESLRQQVEILLSALAPLVDVYPLPHFWRPA